MILAKGQGLSSCGTVVSTLATVARSIGAHQGHSKADRLAMDPARQRSDRELDHATRKLAIVARPMGNIRTTNANIIFLAFCSSTAAALRACA
jgi:hypothetical protein